ncbi:MAG: hypothetical protein ACK40H_07855, partial [Sphingomonadaceae bacterium]
MLKFREIFTRFAFAFALALPLWFLIASFGTRLGLFDWRFGFGTMTFRMGPLLLAFGLLAGLIALGLALWVRPRAPLGQPPVALALPPIVAGVAASLLAPAMRVPPIHDVATDTINPPRFGQEIERLRAATPGGNGVQPMDAPLRTLASYAPMADSPRMAKWVQKSVGEIVRERLWPSAQLLLSAMTLTLLVALPLGMLAAVARDRWIGSAAMTVAFLGYAIPNFVLAVFLILV